MSDFPKLTEIQKKAYDYIVQGKNVFITGPSGTGKSLVVNTFKKFYKDQKKIAITSTTGISAILIGGTTLHSYLGIGLGNGTVEDIVKRVCRNEKIKQRWTKLDVLIIDEISMLSPELLDKIEQAARIIRRKGLPRVLANIDIQEQPFGGIQLVFSGDFLQLPVVGNEDFCFESKCWKKCIDNIVYLNEIVRQPDPEFQQVLNELRYGRVTKKVKELLDSRIGVELKNDLGIKPTRIFTTNALVDEMNEKELDNLSEGVDFYEYNMDFYFYEFIKDREQAVDKYRKSSLAPENLQLCQGAQVMLLTNLDLENGLANGSRGVVIGFVEDLPLVRFLNGCERIIDYYSWEIEEGNKKQARITQVPLRLAWAITCHRSQGCTLDYAEVDLDNVFTYGQVYVAISRVKRKEGLSILSINYDGIKAHPKAIEFYKNLK